MAKPVLTTILETKAMNKVAPVIIYLWSIKSCAPSLGETTGDLLPMTINVGCVVSSIIFTSQFLSTMVMQLLSSRVHFVGGLITLINQLNRVMLFWIAFIFTRSFATFFGDLLTKAIDKSGLEFGTVELTS